MEVSSVSIPIERCFGSTYLIRWKESGARLESRLIPACYRASYTGYIRVLRRVPCV